MDKKLEHWSELPKGEQQDAIEAILKEVVKLGCIVDVDVDLSLKKVCVTREYGWFRVYENVSESSLNRWGLLSDESKYGWTVSVYK